MSGTAGSPRVLRVAFGSFSCTLEGFEEPVEALIAVTDYLRGLDLGEGPAPAGLPPAEAIRRLAWDEAAAGELAGELAGESGEEEAGMTDEPLGEAGAAGAKVPPGAGAGPDAGAARAASRGRDPGDGPERGRNPRQDGGHDMAQPRDMDDRGGRDMGQGADPKSGQEWSHDWGLDEDEDGDEGWFVSNATVAVPAGPQFGGREFGGPGFAESGPGEPDHGAFGRRRLLPPSPDQEEEILRRILSRAESKLSDPEAQRRRETLAHLKAAVAATEAERGDEEAEGARPTPAPLRLVASQRVDLPRMRAAMDGRPRPVRLEKAAARGAARPTLDEPLDTAPAERPGPGSEPESEAASGPESGAASRLEREPEAERLAGPVRATAAPTQPEERDGFAAFATRAGASTLPDLLEAAAVWLGRGAARAEILEVAARALAAPPGREEGLRVFGTLLRQGRIEKVEGGRFQARADSRFALARRAG